MTFFRRAVKPYFAIKIRFKEPVSKDLYLKRQTKSTKEELQNCIKNICSVSDDIFPRTNIRSSSMVLVSAKLNAVKVFIIFNVFTFTSPVNFSLVRNLSILSTISVHFFTINYFITKRL